jgi:hypothetical protein
MMGEKVAEMIVLERRSDDRFCSWRLGDAAGNS